MASFDKIAFVASPRQEAQNARKALTKRYGSYDAAEASVIVALGGDGFMLQTIRRHFTLMRRGLPIYGMNQGTIGFLMNDYNVDDLPDRMNSAEVATISPLKMTGESAGGSFEERAFNEVSLFRQTRQTANINISVDGKPRLERLIADGVMVATPAGSTAYNLSAHGPVIPLGSEILALTPISAYRPRRWRGALLKAKAHVAFDILDPEKRPVSATADSIEIRHVTHVDVVQDIETKISLLFDAGHALDEKILREQFAN